MKNSNTPSNLKNRIRQLLAAALMLAVLASCGTDSGGDKDSNNVTIRGMSPGSPASLVVNEFVEVTYDYEVNDSDGVRIWIQPYTNGIISPGYSYTSSPLFRGSGNRTVRFSIIRGDMTVVDQLKVKIASADGSQTISERFENVNYTFKKQ